MKKKFFWSQVGFNAGNGFTFYSVIGSQTNDVVNIEETSNIREPGRWLFRTDSANVVDTECTMSGMTKKLFQNSMFGIRKISMYHE